MIIQDGSNHARNPYWYFSIVRSVLLQVLAHEQ